MAGVKGTYIPARHNEVKVDPATGLRLLTGNGCSKWKDCFTCPYPPDECHYGENTRQGNHRIAQHKPSNSHTAPLSPSRV